MQIVEVTFLHKSTGVTPTSVLCRPQVAELKTDASEDTAGRPGMGDFRLEDPVWRWTVVMAVLVLQHFRLPSG